MNYLYAFITIGKHSNYSYLPQGYNDNNILLLSETVVS